MPAPDYAVEIEALRMGLASGEARIESDGDSVTYRSITDIQKALTYFQGLADAANPAVAKTSTTIATFRSGRA